MDCIQDNYKISIMKEGIKEISKNAGAILINVANNGCKTIREFNITCSELEDFNAVDITKSPKYEKLFSELKELKGPCLYFFEILSEHSSMEIVDRLKLYSINENSKATPAIKSIIPDSRILYVGKVKRNFWGRLIQHLGYFKTKQTQGLQLFYWATELGLDIKVTVMEFEMEMIELMGVLENEAAKSLQPIIGKHK